MAKFETLKTDYKGRISNIQVRYTKNGDDVWWKCLTCGKISSNLQYYRRETIDEIHICIHCETPFWQ